jgi:N-methylhydantoinase B
VNYDKASVGIYAEIFESIPEEMGFALERMSFSPNIKERRDYSCAMFDLEGSLVAQAAHIPVHLGAMEFLMKKWLSDGPILKPGKFYISNDPYFAGTHLPDISVIAMAEHGYVACRAHHSDIGGDSPGSIGGTDIFSEGLVIAPQELTTELAKAIAESSRAQEERLVDLEAQRASVSLGLKRFSETASKFGNRLGRLFAEAATYSEESTRAALRRIPVGSYEAQDALEDVGDAAIKVRIEIGRGEISFDFTGTDGQVPFGINATEAVTRSACYYLVRCLAPEAPTNAGCWAPVEVIAPKGSLVNAAFPAGVAAGNTETSQRIVDVLLQAMPGPMPACSQGTMNNVAFGGNDWAYYETIGGGVGAGPSDDGADAVHSHMTNTRNTPVEAIEIELPLRVMQYELRPEAGGSGKHRGGAGVVRAYQALEDGIVCTLMTDRRACGPPGGAKGQRGVPGCNTIARGSDLEILGSKARIRLGRGDVVRLETPGGGGWGQN